MAFIDKLKQVSEIAGQVTQSVKGITDTIGVKVSEAKEEKTKKKEQEAAIASGLYEQDGQLIVSSIDGMKKWLSNLGKDATPAIMETLQSQLKVLNTIQSPTMTGMAVDNMIFCLDKAIKQAETDIEKTNIRDAFASMLQSYVFFAEANVRCAEKAHQEESKELLTQAGSILSDAVVKTAGLVAGGSAKLTQTTVKNIFDSDEVKEGYIKKLFAWIGNKTEYEQKINNFYKTIEMLFETLDDYADILGKSILINGMLSRYRVMLVDRRTEQKSEDFRKRVSTIDPAKISALTEGISNSVSITGIHLGNITKAIGAGIGLAADAVAGRRKSMDINSFCMLQDAIEQDLQEQESKLEQLTSELEGLKSQYREIGILKISQKKECQAKIDAKQTEMKEISETLKQLKNKRKEMKDLFPDSYAILKDIKDYEQRLITIEEKF
ncbi:MAG: hypothetical protein Q4F69_01580 [Bacteroidia bacterium]|nr:hypothetical protein [Bacteroidia bacterium]